MLENMSVSKRTLLGVFVPLLGAMLLGLIASWEAYKNYSSNKFLTYVSETISELTALNHKLQIERGLTAIYIGSDFQDKGTELLQARANTDLERDKLHEVLVHIKETDSQDLLKELANLEAEITDLSHVRQGIDGGVVDFTSAMKQYTKTIAHIIEIGFHASKKAKDGELAMETISLLDLTEAKEYAGQERGLMAGLLSKGTVSPKDLVKIEKIIGKQETLLDNFLHNQPLRNQQLFKAELARVDQSAVQEFRDEIVAASIDGHEIELSGAEWFDVASKRIDGLRRVEQRAAREIDHHSKAITNSYLYEAIVVGSISSIIIIFSVILGTQVSRSITRSLNDTTADMLKLADGDVEISNLQFGRDTEFGMMAEAIETFKSNEIKKRELQAEADEERQRAEQSRIITEREERENKEKVERVVKSLGNALNRLADGNLAQGIFTEYAAEFRQLKVDFQNSIHNLSRVMLDINRTSTEIKENSQELQNASDDLSKRTEQQAAALEQTSAAIEQITATVKQSAERADEASQKAATAKVSTKQSSQVVTDAVNAMERIEKASHEISQIISVIDEIAFQTNLLALNAGVEAARAGDAGKGFAVVAQEVRELAQRSATAAKEIKELITNSEHEVSNGVTLVKATGEALNTIDIQVSEIDTHIQSIARATAEQSEGLTEVNRAVSEMDQVTQRNAAMVEETNAVTQQLGQDAEILTDLVGQFKTSEDGSDKVPKNQTPGTHAASLKSVLSAPKVQSAHLPDNSAKIQAQKPITQPRALGPEQSNSDTKPVASPAKSLVDKLSKQMSEKVVGGDTAANWDDF